MWEFHLKYTVITVHAICPTENPNTVAIPKENLKIGALIEMGYKV